jgi:hypothetical protein
MGKYEDLKAVWAGVLEGVEQFIEDIDLDLDMLPTDNQLKVEFLPIILAKGFGEECWEAISGWLSYCCSVKSSRYWNSTPPNAKTGSDYRFRVKGLFADAAGAGITPQPYLEEVREGFGGKVYPIGAFLPDGSFLSYEHRRY